MRSPSNNPSSRIAMCFEECAEVLAKVRAGKPVNDGLNVKFDKHCLTEISCHDPYLLSSVADKSAVQEEMGKASGDLQMSQRPVGDLSEDESVLPANLELSKCAADEVRSSGDLQMSPEKSVPSPKNGRSMVQDVRLFSEKASNSEMVGDDDIRRVTEGCNPSSASKVRRDTILSPRQSVHAGMEVRSADLHMLGDVVAASGVNMSENILQDTLLDLSPMSPKAEFKKVTPFSNIPFSGFTAAEVLENRVKYEVFRECPKFKYNKKGRQTDSSKESRNVWKAIQFLYASLFEIPVHHDTQDQKGNKMQAPAVEEGKGASCDFCVYFCEIARRPMSCLMSFLISLFPCIFRSWSIYSNTSMGRRRGTLSEVHYTSVM